MTSLSQHEAAGTSSTRNAVAPKRVDFTYTALGQFSSLKRFQDLAGSQLVTTSTFGYDNDARLTSLVHAGPSSNSLASYTWAFDAANRLTGFTNAAYPAESATYSYDAADQLTGAVRAGTGQDEAFAFDANGNRSGSGYQTGAFNRTTNDGTYRYEYDAEGNRTKRIKSSDSSVALYAWDHRNRLTNVTERTVSGTKTKEVDLLYDTFDRWIGEKVDSDGEGSQPAVTKRYVYDGTQLLLAFEGGNLKSRYLWGPAVDQILADEVVTSTSSPGTTRWMLTDHLNTVRDVVSNSGTVLDHLAYSSFGIVTSQSNPANQPLILWTGRPYESVLGLQNNWHRWYDPVLGKWISEDPIGFGGGDANLARYVGNASTSLADPTGFDPEYGTREWFHWFYTRNILKRDWQSDKDAQKQRESAIHTADDMYEMVQVLIKADPRLQDLEYNEAARIAFTQIRAAQAAELAKSYARNGTIGPHPDSFEARLQASNQFDDGLVAAGTWWITRQSIYLLAPSGTVPPTPARDLLEMAANAQVVRSNRGMGRPVPSRSLIGAPPKLQKNVPSVFEGIAKTVSNRQFRHIKGHGDWNGGGYFTRVEDAQSVLSELHALRAKVLGRTSQGHLVVRCEGIIGYNNNPGAGYLDQPTDVFMIKGTTKPSVVPISPLWTP